jgi:DNA mismatch repair protein MSH5
VRPQLIEANVIDVKSGRYVQLISPELAKIYLLTLDSHLLQELAVPSFVANDTFVVGGDGNLESVSDIPSEGPESLSGSGDRVDGPSMLLLTGPNYSGKSVYLKQVSVFRQQQKSST